MNDSLLDVRNLAVHFGSGDEIVKAVDGVSFTVRAGETTVLVGESGSGKSITALAVSRLLPLASRIKSGQVIFDGGDLLRTPENRMRDIRGAQIGMIFQEPQSSLNPVMAIGEQIGETLARHKRLSGTTLKTKVIDLLEAVGIDDPERRTNEFPHQFSGGMKQRVMIALALAADPKLLIADEPTTALDVTIQAQVLDLIKTQQNRRGMGILFITHDLAVAFQVADQVLVMKDGIIVEHGSRDSFYARPNHPYSKHLFESLPSWEKRIREGKTPTTESSKAILSVRGLKVYFPIKKGLFKRTVGFVRAVDGVDLTIREGRTLAVVGESGSGKTTMGKGILQLTEVNEGSVDYAGSNLRSIAPAILRSLRSDLQIIFQDPYASMNPRMMIGEIVKEGMVAQNIGTSGAERDSRVSELLRLVGLEPTFARRYPHEFSGGQRQRICIARALAVEPRLIICDEPTSALDVSVQAQILELLRELQERLGISYLFVTHNIGVVAYLAHQVAVMYQGRIIEYGDVEQVLHYPQHEYTRTLLEAVPTIVTA